MNKDTEEAKKIIAENIHMTLATASKSGEPWVSPVFFSFDHDYNLYWMSYINARHSKLLDDNPRAAIVIFNSKAPEGEGDAVYIEANVKKLEGVSEVEDAIKIHNARATKEKFRVKDLNEVTGKGVWRVYKAIPQKVYKLTDGEYIEGQYVDKKIEISLKN